MTTIETLLDFWSEQLGPGPGDWQARFSHWRCHPNDRQYDHLDLALAEARRWVATADAANQPVHTLGAIACLSHSEDIADHDQALRLLREVNPDHAPDPALASLLQTRREIIRQYRRFPARNRTLNRPSTPGEAYFMLGAGQLHR